MRMWQTIRASALGRHVHEATYAALVLSGGYEEAGDRGRFQVKVGDVVFHDRLEAHLDRFSETGAVVLNLRLPVHCSLKPGIARVADPEAIARGAERNCKDAIDLLISIAISRTPQPADWPDELAAALTQNPSLKLCQWGEKNGLARGLYRGALLRCLVSHQKLSALAYAPAHALKSIQDTHEPLASIAAELGFADQSRMTRSVKRLTGIGPLAWRSAANGFKTGSNLDV
jgi:AraC-like DNA-binding protein